MSEIDLVHVDFKNLILRKFVFNFERHRNFVELAGVCAFSRQEEVAGYLHRDGRAALTAATDEHIDDCCTSNPHHFNAVMLIKAVVFRAENGVLDMFGNVGNTDKITTLFTELANESSFSAPNAERDFRTIVCQNVD